MGATVHSLLARRPQPFMARYGISRCLSRGAVSALYEGEHRKTGAAVTIRRTHPHLIDETVRRNVVRDAKDASAVRHANVVAVQEVADLEGDLFIVSDFIEGASLAGLVARKPLPRRIAMRIALDACAGLAAIHAARGADGTRLLHRDISPSNIIVGADGVARLADFGVRKQLDDVDDAAPLRPGKCGYTPPEYILTGMYDARSDVFALGTVLWELFAGRQLFAGTSDDEVLQRALFEDVPSLEGVGITREIAHVIGRAVARPASYRYACASQLEVELEEVTNDRVASHAEVAIFVAALEEMTVAMDEESEPTRIIDMKALVGDETKSEGYATRTG